MDTPELKINDIIDVSLINETIEGIRNIELMFAELLMPVKQIVSQISESIERFRPAILEFGQAVTEAGKVYSTLDALGEAQFVYWDFLPYDFAEAIRCSNNTNRTLREWIVVRETAQVDETIMKIGSFPQMSKLRRLYSQSVNAFREGNNDLAVTGLTSVFDGLLSVVSNDTTHKLGPRVQKITEKLESGSVLDSDEYSTLALMLTFEKTMESFTAPSDFSQKEPKGLNRHWVAHGRSIRRKTKLDCVKMINMIYGMLMITKLSAEEPLNEDY